ncbi:hypothetical protein HNR31_000969 [Anoxybacillus caldiproteolyticus]|uniref:Uncharacterized protein n=1 Tax=Thermaerobacillus caldiproteolyticus TaxID=247480 RepID=A0A7V9Z539_9BACL|nr:hypothetical protein [Anoxybacillus caldiproteolyticus]MBA2874199.1 hypothetical protein [Anoxybacillus caldiproteolyticus]
MVTDIHLRYIEGLLEKPKQIIQDQTKTAEEKLFEIVYMLIHSIKKQERQACIFFRDKQEVFTGYCEKRDQFRYELQAFIEQRIQMGEFRSDLRAADFRSSKLEIEISMLSSQRRTE